MRAAKRHRVVALAAVVGLALAACSDDGHDIGGSTDGPADSMMQAEGVQAEGVQAEATGPEGDTTAGSAVSALSCLPMDPDGWERSDDLIGSVADVVLATDGAVIVALGAGPNSRPVIYHSTDGVAWEPTEGMPRMNLEGPVVDLAGGSKGFVAIGVTGLPVPGEPVVAFSSDGTTWERIDPGLLPRSSLSWFSGVFAGPDGFIIVGTAHDQERFPTLVWYSDDGRTWIETDLVLDDDPVVVTSTGDEWMLLHADAADWPTNAESRVWTSDDGTHWTEVETDSAPPGRALSGYIDRAPLIADDDAAVLILEGAADDSPEPRSPTVWVSTDDGRTWREHTVWDDPDRTGFRIHDTAATESGLFLAGYQDRPGGPGTEFVHHSRDGSSWQHCWTDPLGVVAIESFGDSLVAVTGTGIIYVWSEP